MAGEDGVRIRHERVRANGLEFHVAASGAGDRLALLLHGFPECWFSWRHQLPALVRLGHLAWAPDLRGYGESERPQGVKAYAIEELIADVAGLIEAAGSTSVVLIGHDWGAMIAWFLAMRRPELLDRLVILNVPHPACFQREIRRPRQLLRSWYVFFFQLPWLPEWFLGADRCRRIAATIAGMAVDRDRFPAEVLDVYRKNACRPGALTAMINYYRAALPGVLKRQRGSEYPIIEIPTLMIWGTEDRALGIETTRGTDRYVRDLTLRYLPGVSHWVQQEAPDRVNAMIEAWLQDRPIADFEPS